MASFEKHKAHLLTTLLNDKTIKDFFFQIGEIKYFTTSDRRSGHRLEVRLFDDTISTFPLLWCIMLLNLIENTNNNFNIYASGISPVPLYKIRLCFQFSNLCLITAGTKRPFS